MDDTLALEVCELTISLCVQDKIVHPVEGLSFDVARGRSLGIVGESGCGKSMAGLSILRLLPAPAARIESGTIRVGTVDITKASERELRSIRGAKVAMVFQEPSTAFNPVISVGKQIVEAIQVHKPMGRKAARDFAMGLLSQMGIGAASSVFDAFPHQLSGGMRQRALIAMAVSCSPEVLIADEPTTALDVTVQAQVLDLLQELRDRTKMAQVIISHDLGVVAEIADEIAVMYCGRIVERSSAKQLFSSPRHPYTQALLACLPQSTPPTPGARLPSIEGRVPSLLDRPKGCQFQNRCKLVTKECEQRAPDMRMLGDDHLVRCIHATGRSSNES